MTTYQLNFSPVFSQTNKNSKFVLDFEENNKLPKNFQNEIYLQCKI